MRLAVTWEMCGYVDVEAHTLKEAMEKFNDDNDSIELPNGDYVDGSFQLLTNNEDEMREIINL